MNNTNDNVRIFDQIERYLTEVDADLDVEAGLRRLRLRMTEATESPSAASGAATAEATGVVAVGGTDMTGAIAQALPSEDRLRRPDLSHREVETLFLYAGGMPLKSVARRLGVKEGTVKSRVERIRSKYHKAGRPAHTKADLYLRALEDGFIAGADNVSSSSQDTITSDETTEAFPGDAPTCHVIIHASSEDARQHANYVLRDLGLDPQEVWSTSKAVSFRVSSDDVAAVRPLLEMTNLGWIVVPPGQLDYLLQSLYVEGPDQRKFRVADAPAQQTRAQSDVIAHKVGDADDALVDRVEDGTCQELLEFDPSVTTHAGREAFARCWAEAIVGTSYVSMGRGGLAKYLLGLTHQLVEGALVAEFDPSVGRRVGVDMVAAHFTGPETLSRTLALMAEGLPGLLGSAPPGVDVAGRVAQLTGNMAAGYANMLRERSIDEQDAIYRAGLRARRQAEQALAASEARFRAMFTEAAIGIGFGDLEGNITDANPALQRMFGYTLEEFTQLNFSAMVHPDDPASVWETYGELIRGERDHFRMEKRFYCSDGGEIWTDLTVSLVRDHAGEPAYQVVLLEDVSERHRLQAAGGPDGR